MLLAGALVLLVLIGITISAIISFWWAAETGQFKNPQDAAESIFDAAEPVGQPTDHFPRIKK
jgi:cbb3-type cytochrome oxidase maturation protein